MQVVGLDLQKQLNILQVVAAVLHIGNITFAERKNYSAVYSDDCRKRFTTIEFSMGTFLRSEVSSLSIGTFI